MPPHPVTSLQQGQQGRSSLPHRKPVPVAALQARPPLGGRRLGELREDPEEGPPRRTWTCIPQAKRSRAGTSQGLRPEQDWVRRASTFLEGRARRRGSEMRRP